MFDQQVRSCRRCHLAKSCKGPVPGVGKSNAKIMLIGEAPGKWEDKRGKPFIGTSGKELTNYMEKWAGLKRSDFYVTNAVKCRPPGNRDPYPVEVETCDYWLRKEFCNIRPGVVVCAGKVAAEAFLNRSVDMMTEHGIPQEIYFTGGLAMKGLEGGTVTVIPVYHPAAGLHVGKIMKWIQQDFEAVGKVVRGEWEGVEDEFSRTSYSIINSLSHGQFDMLERNTYSTVAIDTEDGNDGMWSIQFSVNPGRGRLIRTSDEDIVRKFVRILNERKPFIVMHNALYDWPKLKALGLEIAPGKLIDTMIAAYVLGDLPQGLKPLSYRLLGVKMQSYPEVVREATQMNALDYLSQVVYSDIWPAPEPYYKWEGKGMKLVKKPWSIARNAMRMLQDWTKNSEGVDLWAKWHNSSLKDKRLQVEADLGPMKFGMLEDIDEGVAISYACRDADVTLRLWKVLEKRIKDEGLEEVLALDTSILPIVMDMMDTGMEIDREKFAQLSLEHGIEMERLAIEVCMAAGDVLNAESNAQVADFLYNRGGIIPPGRTKGGAPSTDDEALNKIRDQHEVIPLILDYRAVSTRKGTFIDPIPKMVGEDNRVHPTIKTTRTETGRLACASPNLQNIPQRSEQGRRIKDAFIAGSNRFFVGGDYSQIELRLLAHESADENMLRAFRIGVDLHAFTAGQIYGKPVGRVSKDERYRAKTVNFGIPYGLSALKLSEKIKAESHGEIEMSEKEGEAFIAEWFKAYPGVKDFMVARMLAIGINGYSEDWMGRRRWIPQTHSVIKYVREAGLREGFNHIIQGGAAEIMKIGMGDMTEVYVEHWSETPELSYAKPVITIHDSLIFEVPEDVVEDFSAEFQAVMENAASHLCIPVPFEVSVGKTWKEMEEG